MHAAGDAWKGRCCAPTAPILTPRVRKLLERDWEGTGEKQIEVCGLASAQTRADNSKLAV